ncbi:MAG: DUF937 domain-containing protein [Rhodobacteraceae bacterium]|nr:DUF937 domain-containing protein [Paracoccaceae bacterium]
MGLLDGILGGLVGAGAARVIEQVVQNNGGVQGLISNFERNGLGAIAQSWVGTGQNETVSPDQLRQALGPDALSNLAATTGLDPQALLAQLSQHLPNAIDRLTPGGRMPS